MITVCPNCDSMVPMTQELALRAADSELNCPSCQKPFSPFDALQPRDLKVHKIREELAPQHAQLINSTGEQPE